MDSRQLQHHNQHHQQQQPRHHDEPYVTLHTRAPRGDGASMSSADSTYGSGGAGASTPSATHDTSRVNFHVKNLDSFAKSLEDSAGRAFPNRGRSMQRYSKVQVLLLHWKSDDLFVLPELEDLEQCMREDYSFETDKFAIPSENSHLELMLKVGSLIKDHEATDTLFIVYYGGHARIDESRQSTWCATRHSGSPWLQWSAIQTLLERSVSDTLILLDCCAGAASATFPNGKSITETISASSWDAIAPDPGRYSFTNALIEVLQQWKVRTFSAAMLHAEVLARLKHPRPITINGKHFEARSTPVHFMMTSNHRAPSIELGRILPSSRRPPSPPDEPEATMPLPSAPIGSGRGPGEGAGTEPTEDRPHVMISLALEDNQQLDLDAWEQWLASFPALAKYVKVQGVFKSHSTLLLLSLPVMIWDLLPEDHACSFVAFIRSNNMIKPTTSSQQPIADTGAMSISERQGARDEEFDNMSISGTTLQQPEDVRAGNPRIGLLAGGPHFPYANHRPSITTLAAKEYMQNAGSSSKASSHHVKDEAEDDIKRRPIMNVSRNTKWTVYDPADGVPAAPRFSAHIVARLEEYFNNDPEPSNAAIEYFASNLGAQSNDISLWFYHRHKRERDGYSHNKSVMTGGQPPPVHEPVRMILPGHLSRLLEIYPFQILSLDLRPPADFQRSHIHGAANLRAPVSFLEHSTVETIEEAFTDDCSRASFSKWYSAKCIVIYDRVTEFSWECPTAEVLCGKFRSTGWTGKCFILKGHYREFSASYDKYIVGAKTSRAAKEYLESLEEMPPATADHVVEAQDQFDEWLALVENEDHVPSTNLTPAKQSERLRAIQQNQEALEIEFQSRFPELHRRSARPRQQQESWPLDRKERLEVSQGPLVAPLSRALDKMHEAGISPRHAEPPPPPMADRKGNSYSDKLEGGSGGNGGYPPDKPVGGGRGGFSADKLDGEPVEEDDLDTGTGDHTGSQVATGGGGGGESSKKRHQQQQGFWKRIRSSRS